MLHEFVSENRSEIVGRARAKLTGRRAPRPTEEELESGVPLFLDQLVEALLFSSGHTEVIAASAGQHGGDRLRMGFTIAQVVHDYGDVCQAITELAAELDAPITIDEFHRLNKCLDDAIAGAVTEYSRLRQVSQSTEETERSGILAHEMRNKLNSAMLAFSALRTGSVGLGGSTAAVLERSLRGLLQLVNASLAEVRMEAGRPNRARISVSDLVEEIEVDASLEAISYGIELTVVPVQGDVEVVGDRAILAAAMTNLLQNAFKFSRSKGRVSLKTSSTTDRVLFDVEDECGGLPAGSAADLFQSFTQRGSDRTGLGLGLSSSRKGIEAGGGEIRVRDVPGKGCIFTIAMPRHPCP